MPIDELKSQACGRLGLISVERLASYFGTSFEATFYRVATAHPGLAVEDKLKYRFNREEDRSRAKVSDQRGLFANDITLQLRQAKRKDRRQSIHLSAPCAEAEAEYTICFNKPFDLSSIVYKARASGIHSIIESLPILSRAIGRIEAMLCPYQSNNADEEFGDGSSFGKKSSTVIKTRSSRPKGREYHFVKLRASFGRGALHGPGDLVKS